MAAYNLLVSKAQLQRIHAALELADKQIPVDLTTVEENEKDNMELLTSTIGTVLQDNGGEPSDTLYGVCL